MNRDEIRELAAGYVLGGLEGPDRARFENLLDRGDPEALAAVAEFQDTVAALAQASAEPPPPRVRAALMERIAREGRPSEAGGAVERPRARRSLWVPILSGALAAGIAALAVSLALSSSYDRRIEALAREAAAARAELARQRETLAKETAVARAELERQREILALLQDPASQVVSLAGLKPAPEARARMVWMAPAGGYFVAAGLPAVPEGKAYQLWAIVGKRPPVPAGVFTVDAQGNGSLRVPPLAGVEKVDVFAVTLEPAAGVPGPTGAMYLAGGVRP